jgi:hypothetical protein
MTSGPLLAALICCTGLAAASGPAIAQSAPESFRGHIIDTPQAYRGSATFFTLHVDRWGSEEESQAYLKAIKEQGQDAVLKSFWKAEDSGWLRVGSQLGYPVVFARSFALPDGGRLVRAFTDRPMQFYEVRNSLRSVDYPFGIVEIKFDKKGKGEGQLVAAASVKFDEDGQLVLENFGTQPFKLANMRIEEVKEKQSKD